MSNAGMLKHACFQAEKKMEQQRRGNKDTQTSDARFDEQFKLGHQMASKVCNVNDCVCMSLIL